MDFNDAQSGSPPAMIDTTSSFTHAAAAAPRHASIDALINQIEEKISELGEAIALNVHNQNAETSRMQIAKLRRVAGRIDKNRYALHDAVDLDTQAQIAEWQLGLTHPEFPELGKDLAAWEQYLDISFINTADPSGPIASYCAFDMSEGFINLIKVNPALIHSEQPIVYFDSKNHEMSHAGQLRSAPYLMLSPWNKNTNTFLHPDSWLKAITMTERNAYAIQTLQNYLLMQSKPELREDILRHTDNSLVPVREFEEIMMQAPTLQDALIETSVRSLDRFTRRNLAHGRTYNDNYHDSAMTAYWNGFVERVNKVRRSGQSPQFDFVTISDENLMMIGDNGIIPNSLGKDGTLDPRLQDGMRVRSINAREDLFELCNFNNIPAESSCLAYDDFVRNKKAEMVSNHSASSYYAAQNIAAAPSI